MTDEEWDRLTPDQKMGFLRKRQAGMWNRLHERLSAIESILTERLLPLEAEVRELRAEVRSGSSGGAQTPERWEEFMQKDASDDTAPLRKE